MKALIYAIIFALSLGACSSLTVSMDDPAPPAQVWRDFLSAVHDKRYSDTLEKYSANRLRMTKEDVVTQQDVDNYFDVLSTFGFAIVDEIGSYEEMGSELACLTSYGYSSKDEPVSVNVTFVLERELWKIDYLHVIFHQNPKEFPSKATCPPSEW